MREFYNVVTSSVSKFIVAYRDLWGLLSSELTIGQFISQSLPEGWEWLGNISENVLSINLIEVLFFSVGFYIAFVLIKWFLDIIL